MHPTRGLGWVGVGLKKMERERKGEGEEIKNFVERQLNSASGASLSLSGWLSVARYFNFINF